MILDKKKLIAFSFLIFGTYFGFSQNVACNSFVPWSANVVYDPANSAYPLYAVRLVAGAFNLYKANVNNSNTDPALAINVGVGKSWTLMGACAGNYEVPTTDCATINAWSASRSYVLGNQITYRYNNQDNIYQARGQVSAGVAPETVNSPWFMVGVCNSSMMPWSVGGNTVTNYGLPSIGTINNVSIAFKTNNQVRMLVDGNTGNVGIGVSSAVEKLHVGGNILSEGNLIFKAGTGKGIVFEDGSKLISLTDITNTIAQDVWVKKDNNAYIAHTGKVLIGDAITRSFPQDYALAVNGKILATEVLVRKYTNWTQLPDYVFERGYKLLTPQQLEAYVIKHKHLPEVPSAKEMVKDGISLAEMNITLLKKIEELTLYMIDQNKKLDEQAKQLELLKKELELK